VNPQDIPETEKPVSKVQAIKQFLAEHPDASPREVGESLFAQGFEISSAFVSTVRAKLESAKLSVILFFFFPWLAIRLALRKAKG